MTTERMKSAVKFIDKILDVKFAGDINNFNEVSQFLGKYLDKAKTSPYLQYLHDEREYWLCES